MLRVTRIVMSVVVAAAMTSLGLPASAGAGSVPAFTAGEVQADGYTIFFQIDEPVAAESSPTGISLEIDGSAVAITLNAVSQGDTKLVGVAASAILSGSTALWRYDNVNLVDVEAGDPFAPMPPIPFFNLSLTLAPATDPGSPSSSSSQQSSSNAGQAATYSGPVVNPPALAGPVARGAKVSVSGSNLRGITKVEIDGLDCAASVNSDIELDITVPTSLAAGTYDLVVTSSSGKLTVQDGIRVSADSVAPLAGQDVRPSAKKNELSGEVKVRVFDVVGAGKVQIFVNGKEIAWVNATDAADSKLFDGYLVRTVSLVEGKTAIEVFVDGTRVQRWAYGR